jgi:hypothetical protein
MISENPLNRPATFWMARRWLSGSLEAGNVRDCRVRSEVEENLVTGQHARAAVVLLHLERLRRHKTPAPMINSTPVVL